MGWQLEQHERLSAFLLRYLRNIKKYQNTSGRKLEFTGVVSMVKVYNSGNTFEVEQILLTLKENNIPAYKKEDGAGSLMVIKTGFSIIGTDIYVAEENVGKATEIIETITGKRLEEKPVNNQIARNRLVVKLTFAIMLIVVLLAIIGIITLN